MSDITVPERFENGDWPDAERWMSDYDWLVAMLCGSFFLNGGLEDWAAGTTFTNPADGATLADNWTLEKSGTLGVTANITRESTTIDTGTYSMKLDLTVAGSSNSIYAVKQSAQGVGFLKNYTICFGAKVRASTASKVRLRVADGTSTVYSDYHTGDGTWQLLTVTLSVAAAASAVTAALNITSDFTGSVYFDSAFLYLVPAQISTTSRQNLSYQSNRELSSTTFVQSLLPSTDDTYDIGSSTKTWRTLYIGTSIKLQETGGGSDFYTLKAPSSIPGALDFILPATAGASGEHLITDGSGNLSWGTAIKLKETGGGSDHITLQAPASISGDKTYTLPSADGFAGQHLKTDGSGGLDWATDVKLKETGGGSDVITIQAPSSISGNKTYTWPIADGTSGQALKTDGAGTLSFGNVASSGGKNYISDNPDAEVDTTGWATYADAAGTTPVDGTGGSASATFARNTSSPLRGTGMFTLTKGATNRQGDGVSYAFTLDAADKAKVLSISFDYQVSSAFVSGDSSDVRVFIYDVTNSVLIVPAAYTIQGGTGNPHKFVGLFQTSSNSTSYRLIFHIATTNASAWTFDFDNVQVGPQVVQYGAPISDWVSYTPTAPANVTVGSGTWSGFYRRIGDTVQIRLHFQYGSGSSVSGIIQLEGCLPTGITIDNSKLVALSSRAVGYGNLRDDSANTHYAALVRFDSGGTCYIASHSANVANGTVPFTWATSDSFSIDMNIPVTGWSSNVQMSNDTDTRVVAARYNSTSGQTLSAGTIINYENKEYDTHGAVTTGASWKFTAPVSGYYRVQAAIRLNAFAAGAADTSYGLAMTKNAVDYCFLHNVITQNTTSLTYPFMGGTEIFLNAGDYLQFYLGGIPSSKTASTSAIVNWINIERLSGPSAIASTETVAARYKSSAGNTINNNSLTLVDFATKDFDSHGAVTTGASWKFTAPVSGVYQVNTHTELDSQAYTQGNQIISKIYKNGAVYTTLTFEVAQASITNYHGLTGSTLINLLPGDYIHYAIYQNQGNSRQLIADGEHNWISIHRVGNYVP